MLHKKLLRPLTCDRSSPLRSAHVPGHPGAPFKATARVCEAVRESHASADVGVWPFLQDAQASRAPGIRAASARPAWACGGAAPAERPCAARRWLLLAHHLRGCAQGECGRCGNGGRGGDPSPGRWEAGESLTPRSLETRFSLRREGPGRGRLLPFLTCPGRVLCRRV